MSSNHEIDVVLALRLGDVVYEVEANLAFLPSIGSIIEMEDEDDAAFYYLCTVALVDRSGKNPMVIVSLLGDAAAEELMKKDDWEVADDERAQYVRNIEQLLLRKTGASAPAGR